MWMVYIVDDLGIFPVNEEPLDLLDAERLVSVDREHLVCLMQLVL